MTNYTKRQLMELIGHLPEDAEIGFVAAHFMDEGDLVRPLGQHDKEHTHTYESFLIDIGDPDTVIEEAQLEVTRR